MTRLDRIEQEWAAATVDPMEIIHASGDVPWLVARLREVAEIMSTERFMSHLCSRCAEDARAWLRALQEDDHA